MNYQVLYHLEENFQYIAVMLNAEIIWECLNENFIELVENGSINEMDFENSVIKYLKEIKVIC